MDRQHGYRRLRAGCPRRWNDHVLYFAAYEHPHGYELWRSDGTEAGTALVKDIWPGTQGALLNLTDVGDTLYFTADDGTHGYELWKSDGTEGRAPSW